MAGLDGLLKDINAQQAPSEDAEDTISRAQGEVQTRSQKASSSINDDLAILSGVGQSDSSTDESGGFIKAMQKAYASTTNISQELDDYGLSIAPGLDKELPGWLGGGENLAYKEYEEEYGAGFNEADSQTRRNMIQLARAKTVEEEYGAVGDHPVAEFIGAGARELVDPYSLFAFGKGVRGAIATGGIAGGMAGATEGLAETGDIDPEQVFLTAVLGAAAGGIIEAGAVQPLQKLITKYKSAGKAPSAEQLKADLDDSLTPEGREMMDYKKLQADLNANLTYGTGDPEVNYVLKEFNAKDLSGRKSEVGVTYDEATDFEFKSAMYDKWTQEGVSLGTFERGADGKPKSFTKLGSADPNAPVDFTIPDSSKLISKPKNTSSYSDPAKRSAFVAKHSVEADLINNADNGYRPKKRGGKPEFHEQPKGFPTKVRETRMINKGTEPQYLDRKMAEQAAEKEQALKFFDGMVKLDSYTWKNIKQDSLNVQGSKMRYSSTGEPGSEMYNIIASGHVPWTSETGKKIRPPIGERMKDDPFPEESWNMTSGSISRMIDGALSVLSPERRLSFMKDPIGKIASKYLRDAHVNTNWRIGESVSNYRINRLKNGIKAGSPEEQMAHDVLNRTLDVNKVPANVRKFAETVQKQLNEKYSLARELGIITDKEYQSAVARGIEKGYLPRVTDMDKLQSKAGREEFINRLSSKVMSLDSAEKIVSAIARDEKETIRLTRLINKQGDRALITRALAKELWKNYNVISPTYRSKHLEAPRKLPEEWEEIMAPFQVQDLEAIMASWAQDVNTRIEYAKVFGAKDENAIKIVDRLAETDPEKSALFFELFHTAVGSAESETVRTFINKPLRVRQIVSRLKALQTMKLAMAAIPNLSQGPLNGMYYVMSKSEVPTPKALTMWAKAGIKATRAAFGDAEARYTYDKFGAATQTMLLDAMGGMNESMHTVMGKKYTNVFAEFFNNPSVMLRKVGYFNVEEFSRRYGQFLGEAMVEDSLERKARLMAMGNRANPKLLKKVDDTLIELGLDPTVDPTKLSVNDVGLAGQRVANILNFTNDPQTSPLIMQSFWGKFFTQFKTYIVKQTDFIGKRVIQPALEGNLRPLMAVMAVGTPVGMSIDSFRRTILGDDKELTTTERLLRAHALIGTMGVLYDIGNQAVRSPTGLAAWVAGPTVGDAGKYAFAAGQSVNKGSIAPLGKAVASTFVYPYRQAVVDSIATEKSNFDTMFDMKFGGEATDFDMFKD